MSAYNRPDHSPVAAMKAGSGSFDQFERRRADGRYRRVLLVAAYSGEDAFTKPITAARFGGGS